MLGSTRYPSAAAFAVGLACFAGSAGSAYAQGVDEFEASQISEETVNWEEVTHETLLKDSSFFHSGNEFYETQIEEEDLSLEDHDGELFDNTYNQNPIGFAKSASTYELDAEETLEPQTRIVQKAEAFSGVPEDVLMASRERFKRTFHLYNSPKVKNSNQVVASHFPLSPEKAYTFLNGDLVEIDTSRGGDDKPYPLWEKTSLHTESTQPIKIVLKPQQTSSQTQFNTAPLKGRIKVPNGLNPQSVVLQLGGTPKRIRPNIRGDFEFPNLPIGSSFSIVAWDENNELNRRLYTVDHHSGSENHKISFVKTALVDQLSGLFGSPQQIHLSGFCGRLEGVSSYEAEGALIEVRGQNKTFPVFYFNDNHLPDPQAPGLTLDGRFCSFNIDSQITSVLVELPNGSRRRFVVPFKASTFESHIDFPMGQNAYRPVKPLEYVDTDIGVEAASSKTVLESGNYRPRHFLQGLQAPLLALLNQLVMNTDKTYRSVWASNNTQHHYFPLTNDFTEVYSKSSLPDDIGSFQLFSGKKIISSSDSQPLQIKTLGAGIRDALAVSLPDLSSSWENQGSVFLDLDLAKLGIESVDQISLAVRDPWTSKPVGHFHPMSPPPDVKKPRFLRGFFTDIPEGQYTLVVMNEKAEVKWLDTIRAYKKSLQVLSLD